MRKRILSIIICIVAILGVYNIVSGNKQVKKPDKIKKTSKYTAYEYKGKIGVFLYNSKKPQQTLSISVSSLPPKDRLDLDRGIKIKNDKELLRFIEDFDG